MKWRKLEVTAIIRGKKGGGTTRSGDRNTGSRRRTIPYEGEFILDPLHPADEEGSDILPGGIDHFVPHVSKTLRERRSPWSLHNGSKHLVANLTDLGKDLVQEPIGLINEQRLPHTELPGDHEDKRCNRRMPSK